MSIDTTTSPATGGAPAARGADVEGVVAIFGRVLENPGVHAGSHFFELGGDSLVATRVLSQIARNFRVELTFEDFVQSPTPEGLAAQIAAAR